jgi:bifunctional DNase/RNase
VNKIIGDTFYAEITTTVGNQQHIVDARPSDALALAVRAGVPIYAARAVVEQASGPDDDAFWIAMTERVRQFHARASQPDEAQQPSAE